MSITFKEVSHCYSPNTVFSYVALDGLNLELPLNKMVAIVGNTGSGKSTLVQHLNALLLPTSGEIDILNRHIDSHKKPKDLKSLRKSVGLVFQFPEYQLFEESIEKDICFGPMNFNQSEEEAKAIASKVINLVGLDDSYLSKSPFDLSGGQKRRVAIAGILAMNPEILVLDEPTAGLDPQGAKQMMELFHTLNSQENKTIYIVTHDMEHVLNHCDEVIVLKDGKLIHQSDVKSFFEKHELLEELKIAAPQIVRAEKMLKDKDFNVSTSNSLSTLVQEIIKEVR